jgi:hypothetical protein
MRDHALPLVSFDNPELRSAADCESGAVLEAADRIAAGELSMWGRRVDLDSARPYGTSIRPPGKNGLDRRWRGTGRGPAHGQRWPKAGLRGIHGRGDD